MIHLITDVFDEPNITRLSWSPALSCSTCFLHSACRKLVCRIEHEICGEIVGLYKMDI